MVLVPVYQGGRVATHAVVDDDDYVRVAGYRWQLRTSTSGVHYARCNVWAGRGCRSVYMHMLVLGARDGMQVDHKDRDGLNNRRSNLRHVTHARNAQNRDRSKFPGVKPWRGRWRTDITVNDKRTRRTFDTYEEAEAEVARLLAN